MPGTSLNSEDTAVNKTSKFSPHEVLAVDRLILDEQSNDSVVSAKR